MRKKYVIIPEIKLSGKWLVKIGFKEGMNIIIEEKDKEIVVSLDESNEILGLISLIHMPEEYRIHISLIENSKENKGKNKKINGIAGCLIAFTARLAFDKGYLEFVSLVPKTELLELYIKKYRFSQYGRQLAIERKASINLIQKYL